MGMEDRMRSSEQAVANGKAFSPLVSGISHHAVGGYAPVGESHDRKKSKIKDT